MWLYSGTGNVFVLADARFEHLPEDSAAVLAEQRAEAPEASHADGLILVTFDLEVPRVVFRNLDGSRPEACGNGLRCAALHVARTGGPSAFELDTDAGRRRVRVEPDGQVEVSMGPADVGEPCSVDVSSGSVELVPVQVGNPHAVLFVADPAAIPLAELGPDLEHHARFPRGVNVEVVALTERGLDARVWERGVGETRACGTGACAAAAAAVALGRLGGPVAVRMPGGELRVRFDGDEVWLAGAVEAW